MQAVGDLGVRKGLLYRHNWRLEAEETLVAVEPLQICSGTSLRRVGVASGGRSARVSYLKADATAVDESGNRPNI